MDSLSNALVAQSSSIEQARVQATASVLVLKKALDLQAAGAAQLLQALPQPALAPSGTLGTLVNTYA